MCRHLRLWCVAALAFLSFCQPELSGAVQRDGIRIEACRRVTCEAAYAANGVYALVEIRGRSPGDARQLLYLTVYEAATSEIAYYDTVEAAADGDFIFRVAVASLRPGSYTFTIHPRSSGALLGGGALTAAPSELRSLPLWRRPGSIDEYRQ